MVKFEKWRDEMDQSRKRRGKVRELEGRGGGAFLGVIALRPRDE